MEFALGNKLFEKGCVTIDGRMDEPVWQEVETFTGFKALEANPSPNAGPVGHLYQNQTVC